MACNISLTGGFQLGCLDNTGGTAEVYIASYDRSVVFTLDADEVITAMTNSANTFHLFEQAPETATFEEVETTNIQNGTVSYVPTAVIVLNKITPETRNLLRDLAKGYWRVIIKDNNGNYQLIGKNSPAYVSTATSSLGQATGDLSGRTITFTATAGEPAYFVDEALLPNVLEGMSIAAPTSFYPSALAATGATLNWSAVATATGYVVERSTTADFAVAIPVYTGALLTVAVTGLTTATHYYFRVKATRSDILTSTYKVIELTTP